MIRGNNLIWICRCMTCRYFLESTWGLPVDDPHSWRALCERHFGCWYDLPPQFNTWTHSEAVWHCMPIDPSDWVKLLTMQDPMSVVKEGQWIRVHNWVYKGDLGFVTHVAAWGAKVLVVPCLKTPSPQADISLKRKQTAIKPEPRLFNLNTFLSVFQCQPKLNSDGSYTSCGLVFHHGLLLLKFDLHSISPNSAKISSRILALFNLSSHPAITGSEFPCLEEWIFEEGESHCEVNVGNWNGIMVSNHLFDLANSVDHS